MGARFSETPGVRRWRRRRRWACAAVVACAVLTPVAWAACAVSYMVEWSGFTAGPQRVRAAGVPGAVAGGSPANQVERDETHWMFGHGRVAIVSFTVYSTTFDHPASAMNSRNLAWATFDDWFIGGPWRFGRYPQGPLMGVSLWVPATALTGLSAFAIAVGALCPRRRPWECAECGYDLRGTAARPDSAGRCPECGRGVPRAGASGAPDGA